MDLQQYLHNKKKQKESEKHNSSRSFCSACWQPAFNCFCFMVEKFNPHMEFVILIHPIESRRRIATGRMSYLGLENSHILRGSEFSSSPTLKSLLSDPKYKNVILSPGEGAVNLTDMSEEEKLVHFPNGKKLRIFVIDGTWSNARGMLAKTPGLQKLPRFYFTPNTPSNIRVRKQPNPMCYSTLEAIHYIIDLLGESQGFNTNQRAHDKLLKPFNWMIERQIERLKEKRAWRYISKC